MIALLFVFEFLGTTELLVILVVALVLFGPRKLPELGRSLGKSLAEFKRATDDFKHTWEREVELDKIEREMRIEQVSSSGTSPLADASATPPAIEDAAASPAMGDASHPEPQTIARGAATPNNATANADALSAETSIAPPTSAVETSHGVETFADSHAEASAAALEVATAPASEAQLTAHDAAPDATRANG